MTRSKFAPSLKAVYTDEQIKRVLTGAGIKIEAEFGNDFIVYCPYHNNSRTPAGEVAKDSGLFFCFGCQTTKTLEEFLMFTSDRTYFEAIRFIKSKETESNIQTLVMKVINKQPDFLQYDDSLIKRLNAQALVSPRAISYFRGRKIEKESVVKFNLGYSEAQDSVTIPVQAPDGTTIGFVARTVEGKAFKNTPGLPKGKVLFNLHRVKSAGTVYIVESSFDAIRLDQVGLPAVATLGANVSLSQIQLLGQYFYNMVLIADNDDAGKIMADRLREKLGVRISVITLDEQYKDIGDMDDDAIRSLEFQFDKSIENMLK
jgi:DNA primase